MYTSNDVHGASEQARLGGARADAGVDHRQKRNKLQFSSGLTLTAAERNLCEEEINQVSEARGHDTTMLSFAKVN